MLLVRKKGINGWKAMIASMRSKTAVLTITGDLRERTVLKFVRASWAISACFLKDDSEGMMEMLSGFRNIKDKDKTRTFIIRGVIQIWKEYHEKSEREIKMARHWRHFVGVQNFENQLITSIITTKKENYMTKTEIKIMGNKSMTEDSQY